MELNKIYNDDNVKILKTFPDNCIDMVITSPPYEDIRDYESYVFNFPELAHELARTLKNGGVIAWNVDDKTVEFCESLNSFKQAIYFVEQCNLKLLDTMIYNKINYLPRQLAIKRYQPAFEYVFIFTKNKPKTFNPIVDVEIVGNVDRKTHNRRQKDGSIKVREIKYEKKKYRARGNVWNYNTGYMLSTKDKIAFQHPAIMHEQLVEDLMISWTNENDIVLDPFMGSGTTGKVAVKNNRNYVGIEISEKYCNIANERIANVMQKLF